MHQSVALLNEKCLCSYYNNELNSWQIFLNKKDNELLNS